MVGHHRGRHHCPAGSSHDDLPQTQPLTNQSQSLGFACGHSGLCKVRRALRAKGIQQLVLTHLLDMIGYSLQVGQPLRHVHLLQLAQHAPPLHQSLKRIVGPLRRKGHRRLPSVAGFLRPVCKGHGTEARWNDAGKVEHQRKLRARELRLGFNAGQPQQQTQHHQGQRFACHKGRRGNRYQAGNAAQKVDAWRRPQPNTQTTP